MSLKFIINTITDVLISIKPQFSSKFFIFYEKINKIKLFSKMFKIMCFFQEKGVMGKNCY